MSSLSGVFNSIATLFVNDYYRPKYTGANDRKLVLIGRLATTTVVIVAILCVPLIKAINSEMYLFLQSIQSYISAPITAVFIFGFLFKTISSKAAFLTIIIGEIVGLSRFVTDILGKSGYMNLPFLVSYSQINFLHFTVFLFLFCTLTLFLTNYLFHKLDNIKIEENYFDYSFRESLLDVFAFKKTRNVKVCFILSGVIFLIIIGVWGLWS